MLRSHIVDAPMPPFQNQEASSPVPFFANHVTRNPAWCRFSAISKPMYPPQRRRPRVGFSSIYFFIILSVSGMLRTVKMRGSSIPGMGGEWVTRQVKESTCHSFQYRWHLFHYHTIRLLFSQDQCDAPRFRTNINVVALIKCCQCLVTNKLFRVFR